MKKLKLIISTILLFLIAGIALAQTNIVFAATTKSIASGTKQPIWFALSKTFSDDPGNIGYTNISNKKIYDVRAFNSNSDGSELNIAAYCLRAGFGNSWNNGSFYNSELDISSKLEYSKYSNLADANAVKNAFPNVELVSKLVDTSKYYNEIMWLLDNMYIPKISSEAEKNQLFELAKIGNGKTNEEDGEIYNKDLTESDIEAVNQLAIWYFTNYKLYNENDYKSTSDSNDNTEFLKYLESSGTGVSNSYNSLETKSWSRNQQAKKLFKYYIAEAEKVHSGYNTAKPIEISQSDNITGNAQSANTVIGPITLTKHSDIAYELKLEVTGQSNYTVRSENGTQIEVKNNTISSESLKDLWGEENSLNIYIEIPSKVTTQVSINITTSYRNKTLWLNDSATSDTNAEQPIVVVEKVEDKVNLKSTPEEIRFDLKLVKYISQVNSQNIPQADWRTDNGNAEGKITIDSSKLKDGTATTADYQLKKDPVLVDYGDIIVYTIRVYNEGELAGYASEISEDIPAGLEFVTGNEINTKYGWVLGEDGIARTTYLAKKDNEDNLLAAFDSEHDDGAGSGLSSKYVQIALRVTPSADISKIIRNEAAITKHQDASGEDLDNNKVGVDRDSQPGNWVGKDDHNKYQDDEDYDNVRLKILDLALRKYITKVNDQNVPTREPDIDKDTLSLDVGTQNTTATYKHRKDPVEIKDGDKVTYNITIYNEGNKAGYAKRIIDQLPTGLIYNNEVTTVTATRKSGTGNTYTVSYDAETNKITLTANTTNALNAYDENTLDEETVELVCTVKQTPDARNSIYLTNIAWIDLEHDSEKNVDVPGNELGIHDRDSKPEEHPTNVADDLNTKNDVGYTGKTNYTTESQLQDSSKYYEGQEDDDDFEKLVLRPVPFDLALRKFIVKVDAKDYTNEDGTYTRAPKVDTTNLYKKDESGNYIKTTATYNHTKEPVYAQVGDKVVYVIRVYNEGQTDGYVGEITDYLPENLEFVKDSKINNDYGWSYDEETRKVTTTYLSSAKSENLLLAFDSEKDEGNGEGLSYKDVQIECTITDAAKVGEFLTNIAEISKYENKNGEEVNPDTDSTSDNLNYPTKDNLPSYKDDEIGKKDYIPGQEDDDDFEKLVVNEFDLALRKYITKVQDKDINNRKPEITYENGKLVYKHTKEPVLVTKGDIIEYTLVIYNEGTLDGYASEITDYILKNKGLVYLKGHETNEEYGWKMYDADGNETDDVSKAVTLKTDYLSKEAGEARMKEGDTQNPNLLKAFDKNAGVTETNPDRRILKIAYQVEQTTKSKEILVNIAEISDDSDEDGDEIKDIDSTPGTDEKDYPNNGHDTEDHEDDIDYDQVEVTEFDLALRKWVTQAIVIENGKETVMETGHKAEDDPEDVVKVELDRKKLSSVVVKFRYSIRITNQGDIEGYAKEITDYVPAGLKFVAEDNPDWKDEGNNIISTRKLENTLLKPGESAEVEVLLTWINGNNNLGTKTNIAEISEDYNDQGVPDRDSTPDNQKPGEDDIDDAPVMLAVKTGGETTYYALAFVMLITLAGGILLIKKYVL